MVVLEFMMMSFGALNVLEAKERINQRMRELPVEIITKQSNTSSSPRSSFSIEILILDSNEFFLNPDGPTLIFIPIF
jgi:hypothetical protein